MSEKPREPSRMKTIYLPVAVASAFALGLFLFAPQIGLFAIGSAFVGTVLFMSVWGSFYS